MLHTDLRQTITPFRPFRITTTNGETYEVRHREAYLLTPSYITIGLLPSEDRGVYTRTKIIDLFHIVSIEPLEVPVQTKGNGETS